MVKAHATALNELGLLLRKYVHSKEGLLMRHLISGVFVSPKSDCYKTVQSEN